MSGGLQNSAAFASYLSLENYPCLFRFSHYPHRQIFTLTPQAMISGVKAQIQTLDEIERLEEAGMEALRNRFVQKRLGSSFVHMRSFFCREFSTALETLDQALGHASGCVRLKMARGDCLAHLGRYIAQGHANVLLLLPDIKGNHVVV